MKNSDDFKPASSRDSINETSQRTRRILDDAFKTKVVLAALREDKTDQPMEGFLPAKRKFRFQRSQGREEGNRTP